jgi:hypothetical protein
VSLEGQRLGAALAEENARRARIHIPHATFTCIVSGKTLDDMAIEAWKACTAYFDEQNFEITDLDAEALQNVALEPLAYTARVRARAV